MTDPPDEEELEELELEALLLEDELLLLELEPVLEEDELLEDELLFPACPPPQAIRAADNTASSRCLEDFINDPFIRFCFLRGSVHVSISDAPKGVCDGINK